MLLEPPDGGIFDVIHRRHIARQKGEVCAVEDVSWVDDLKELLIDAR